MNLKSIINEEIQKIVEVYGQSDEPMDFLGLAMMIGRLYPEELKPDSQEIKAFISILQDAYDSNGDLGVMERFKSFTDIAIKPVGLRKYVYDYRDNKGQQIPGKWNYKYPGD